jgi:hypothetical protein
LWKGFDAPVSRTSARPFNKVEVFWAFLVKGTTMQRLGRIALVLAVAAMVSSSALAQERQQRQRGQRPQGQQQRGQRGGFAGGFGGGTLFLLNQKSVQDELKLSDEQVKKAKELSDKQRESFGGLRDLGQEERRAKIQEQAKATEKAVSELLKPEQLKRVKQISLQQQGARALSNPEVATALSLSDEQKDKIRSIQQEARTGRGQGGGGRPSEEELKKREEARKATNEKVLNVLTAEQKTKWKEMTGEPFKGEISRPQFRRPQTSQR